MKKLILISLLCGLIVISSGCFEKNNLDNATIYTTVYPIEYFTNVLYGNHSTIESIYPDGAKIKDYSLTEKQKNTYSEADLFIYNGVTEEKQIAKDFTNKNRNLKIIDVAYGLKYTHGEEELWLSPNNALMLASNIKDNLKNLINSKFVNEEIDSKYKDLEETLSLKDAELRSIAKTAMQKGKNTLIVSSNMFRFLEDYGFSILSLEDANENSMNTIIKNFKNGTYKYLFIKNTEEINETINNLKNNNASIITVHTMTTLNDENRKNNDTYLTLIQEFIENIKNVVLT